MAGLFSTRNDNKEKETTRKSGGLFASYKQEEKRQDKKVSTTRANLNEQRLSQQQPEPVKPKQPSIVERQVNSKPAIHGFSHPAEVDGGTTKITAQNTDLKHAFEPKKVDTRLIPAPTKKGIGKPNVQSKEEWLAQEAEARDKQLAGAPGIIKKPLQWLGHGIDVAQANIPGLADFQQGAGQTLGIEQQTAPVTGGAVGRVAKIAGSLAGGAVNPAALEASAVTGAGRVTTGALQRFAPQASPFVQRLVGNAAEGALQGAANTAASGRTSFKDVAGGAGMGAAGGAAFEALGTGIGSAFRKLFNRNGVSDDVAAQAIDEIMNSKPQQHAMPEERTQPEAFVPPHEADPVLVGPNATSARITQKINPWREKYNRLIELAHNTKFTPGRELEELDQLWGSIADREDPSLDDLIKLAHPTRFSKVEPGLVGKARKYQESRLAAGVDLPVRPAGEIRSTLKPEPLVQEVPKSAPAEAAPIAEPQVPKEGLNYGAPGSFYELMLPELQKYTGMPEEEVRQLPHAKFRELYNDMKEAARAEMQDAPPPAEEAAPAKHNWFTALFGQGGVGIVAGGGTFGGRAVRSEDVLVRNKLLNDSKGILNGISAGARDLKHNHIDRYDSLKAFGPDVYEAAMDSARANNVANNIVGKHFVTPEGNVIKVKGADGKEKDIGLQSIFQQVHRGYDKQFVDYLTLRHAETRIGRGERVYAESIKDPNDPNRAMNTVEAVRDKIARYNKQHPEWVKIAQDWDSFNDNMLQHYGVAEGLLKPEQYAAMRQENPFYASMMRQFSRSEKPSRKFIGSQTGAQFSGQKAPIKEVSPTGSARKIVDPRKSAIEQAGAWANAAFRNRVMQGIVDKIKADPDAYKGIAEIIKAPQQGDSRLQEALSDPNHDYLNLLKNDFDSLFGKGKPSDDNVVRAMVNGEPVYIKVHNPEIVRSLAAMSPQESGLIVSMLQKFSNAVKTGATGALAPLFATRGATVDVVASLIQSKNPIYHLPDLAHAVLGSLNLPGFSKLVREYEQAGGKYSAALKGDRQLNKSLAKLERPALLSAKSVGRGVVSGVLSPFKLANKVSDVAENVNRIAAYKGEMRRLGNVRTPENVRMAMKEAREITTNFSRRGAKSQELEALFPYNNAAIQGTRRVVMGFKNPKTAIKTLAGITALSILPKAYEYAQFHDDPDYQNLTARERYRNNIVAKLPNGKFLKVPVEPAYGAFGEAAIETMRRLKDHDPAAFKGAADALVNAFLPPAATGAAQGLTQGTGIQGSLEGMENATSIAPVTAAINNTSFTGAPIVPMDVEGRTDKYEYDERTSWAAKEIGKYTGYSPMKVDYLIKAYGGDPARMILPVTSAAGGGNVRDSLLKNFVLDPTYSNNLTQDFYDAKEKLNSAYQDNKDLDIPFPSWYDEDMRKKLSSTAAGSITKKISNLRDQKSEIQSDKSLSKQQKTEQLQGIQKQINDIYLDINAELSKRGIIR